MTDSTNYEALYLELFDTSPAKEEHTYGLVAKVKERVRDSGGDENAPVVWRRAFDELSRQEIIIFTRCFFVSEEGDRLHTEKELKVAFRDFLAPSASSSDFSLRFNRWLTARTRRVYPQIGSEETNRIQTISPAELAVLAATYLKGVAAVFPKEEVLSAALTIQQEARAKWEAILP